MLQDLSVDTSIGTPFNASAVTSPERLTITRTHEHTQVPVFDIRQLVADHHQELVCWLRLRLSIPEDASDIAQEAYLRILKYENVKEVNHPLALLYRIARNLVIDAERRNTVRHSKDHVEERDGLEIPYDMPDFGHALDVAKALRRVHSAIDSLSPRCRDAFLLNRLGNMSYREVADHLGISVKMVEKHISKALLVCHRSREELPGA